MTPVVPRPSFCISTLRGSRIPLTPYPESPDPKHSLDDELRGPTDPAIAEELGRLMWRQHQCVWDKDGGFADPYLTKPVPELDTGSPSAQSLPEASALYGPPPRNNESVRLGESLANQSVIVVDDDDDDGFEGVLDLYRGAVQGSMLSAELELELGGDLGLTCVGWEASSTLEISVKGRSPAPSPSGVPQESRIHTLEEYKRVVEAEKALPPSESVSPKEEPPLGIEWSYNCCGYITGRVVNPQKAKTRR